jgi:hypothetical protein
MGQLESSALEDEVIDWLLARAARTENKQVFAEFMGL